MAAFAEYNVIRHLSRKRKAQENVQLMDFREMQNNSKKRFIEDLNFETEAAQASAVSSLIMLNANRKQRGQNEERSNSWWTVGYENWDEESFKKRLRVNRTTFEFILNQIRDRLEKTPTYTIPNPTPPSTQLSLCLYRLASGCTLLTVGDLFGVAESTAQGIFADVCKALVECLYDRYVQMPKGIDEWSEELKNFLENWHFPCVGAWGGFHVYVSTRLKNFYSFKKRYSITNMALIGYNKRFLWASIGAPGSTHDARLLRTSRIYSDIENGLVFPQTLLNLHPHGSIPFTTVGDSAFPSHSWLLKPYKEGTRVPMKRYFNRRLCSARVVSKHAYGMLKGRWRILYKKMDCHIENIPLVIMSCIALHNLCIYLNDPCNPRWCLEVDQLNLFRGREQSSDANTTRDSVAKWLWDIKIQGDEYVVE